MLVTLTFVRASEPAFLTITLTVYGLPAIAQFVGAKNGPFTPLVLTSSVQVMAMGITVTTLVSWALTGTTVPPLVIPKAFAVTTLVSVMQRVTLVTMQVTELPAANVGGKWHTARSKLVAEPPPV